jgi:hypothetical protein
VTDYHSHPANKALHFQRLLHNFPTSLANLLCFFLGAGLEHGYTEGTRFDVLQERSLIYRLENTSLLGPGESYPISLA